VSPEAFPWEDMLASINALVHKGREAGWLAQPSEVSSTCRPWLTPAVIVLAPRAAVYTFSSIHCLRACGCFV
jgi:hypothetical protein